MINTLNPASTQGHDDKRGEVLERISREYGKPEEKQREAVKKLGKDEFFKIMITQIQHQDPLKPAQNEQMAAQMAQFTSLEQMVNMNQNLEKLAMAQQPIANMGAANLIGKYVTTDSSRVVHSEGKYTDLNFELPADAAKVHLTILNEKGENVREFERTKIAKGPVKIEWDGKKSNNMSAPTGIYMVQISAVNDNDKQIQVKTTDTKVVHGVAFEGKDTVLLTGDIRNPTKMLLRNVTKIIDAAQQPGVQNAGGVQIGGLENIIGADEKSVPDAVVGQNAKFAPVNIEAIKRAQEKPEFVQPPSQDEIRKMIQAGPDLSAANLAAEAVAAGKALPGQATAPKSEISDVNPAARERGYSAGGQSGQSSRDGSTVGKLGE